ncbi:caspase family protein [Burkholderia cepacia]|uniref:caspase family protein n=1 Tax=Burkholderia cepacia TaxID=292 RepID=UPI001C94BDB8|nr:caspase family protein [Burkholderia cepacia]MBY4804629.1 caspase family protein [Burkholderia cepacia]MCA8326737.1 caspase family protein [Burkholderia cepacia]
MLPANGAVKALVIGIEDYQIRPAHSLPTVDYARDDAEGFMAALEAIYGDRLVGATLVDNHATLGNLEYELQSAIRSLEADDLFIFYYAGHGFLDMAATGLRHGIPASRTSMTPRCVFGTSCWIRSRRPPVAGHWLSSMPAPQTSRPSAVPEM